MKVLCACEESQAVCKEFRKLGHEAYSCDLLPSSGGHPEWHIKDDVLYHLEGWDLIIAFPPCTYLTNTGNKWFSYEYRGMDAFKRWSDRLEAAFFFMQLYRAPCNHIAIENPIGFMNSFFKKPDQIIQPYMFGDPERKSTCLWLKNLPLLTPTNIVTPNIIKYRNGKGTDSNWHIKTMSLPPDERSKVRSKTFPGIAKAMALQWHEYMLKYE